MDNKQKSKEYWEKRARENENKVYAKGSEVKKALEEHYLKAKKEIRKSISELVARYMDKTELSYMEAVKNLTSSEIKEWRMTLEEYEEEIKRLEKISPEFAKKLRIELETLATKSRITRLDSLNAQIDMELAKKSIKDYDVIRDGVSKTYSDFFKIQTTEFGFDGANTVLPKKTIEMLMQQPWSGASFSERIWDNSSALARVLKQEIIQAFMQGVSVKDLSDRIEKRFENDRYNTERLVRTELNYALNQSTKLSYDEAGIKEYEFLAEIDSRTSDICRELNGQIFKMKDARAGVNYPPMHPHCRSTTIPVMNYEDIKTRKTKSKSEDDKKKEKTEPIKNGIIKIKDKFVFKVSNTVEEATDYARQVLNIRANYSKFNLEVANLVNEEITKFYNVFGNLKEQKALDEIDFGSHLPESAVAAYNRVFRTIFMKNVKTKTAIKTMKKQAIGQFELGFWSTNNFQHVIRHEAGHAIQHMILDKNPEKAKLIEELRKEIANKYGVYGKENWLKEKRNFDKMKIIGEEISYYALYTDGELVAESVAEYMAGNPRDIAKKVMEILLKED